MTTNRKRGREEEPDPLPQEASTPQSRSQGGLLSTGRTLGLEQEFPPDLVDEILCWSCEGRPSRALQLALVCRLWYDRFKAADRLWPLVVVGLHRKVSVAVRTATYSRVQQSIAATRTLLPLPPSSLHPIEDCTLEFACPMYAEALRVVGPGVSYCSVCKENVYTVRTQAEMDDARQLRRCVQFSANDLAAETEDETVVAIAIIFASADAAKSTALAIAANSFFSQRSPGIFPVLDVDALSRFFPRFKFHFFSSAEEATAFPAANPVKFSLVAAVASVKVDTLRFPKPFKTAIQAKSVVRLTQPDHFVDELLVAIEGRFQYRPLRRTMGIPCPRR